MRFYTIDSGIENLLLNILPKYKTQPVHFMASFVTVISVVKSLVQVVFGLPTESFDPTFEWAGLVHLARGLALTDHRHVI